MLARREPISREASRQAAHTSVPSQLSMSSGRTMARSGSPATCMQPAGMG